MFLFEITPDMSIREGMVIKLKGSGKAAGSAPAATPRGEPLPAECGDPIPLTSKVNCGGRNLTLENAPPPEILPLVTKKIIALKRPYLHYRLRAA
jgi:hypothetical protein